MPATAPSKLPPQQRLKCERENQSPSTDDCYRLTLTITHFLTISRQYAKKTICWSPWHTTAMLWTINKSKAINGPSFLFCCPAIVVFFCTNAVPCSCMLWNNSVQLETELLMSLSCSKLLASFSRVLTLNNHLQCTEKLDMWKKQRQFILARLYPTYAFQRVALFAQCLHAFNWPKSMHRQMRFLFIGVDGINTVL